MLIYVDILMKELKDIKVSKYVKFMIHVEIIHIYDIHPNYDI